MVDRVDVPYRGSEREQLRAMLDYHRATAVMKLEGLDDEQVRREMVPSKLSLLGLIKHLTSVEHAWFTIRLAGRDEPFMFATEEDPDADFRIEPHESTREIADGYVQMCAQSRAIEGGIDSLDDTFEHPSRGTVSVRWLLLHMIEETARHAGHADIIREQLDGKTGTGYPG